MEANQLDIDTLKAEIDEYGFVVLHDQIPTSQSLAMATRLMEIMNAQPTADRRYQGLRGVFNYLKPEDDELFLPMVTNPTYQELARHLLGEGIQMAEVGAVWNKPGATMGNIHADVPVGWFARQGRPIPDHCFMVNCIWMLTEFTHENGGTQLLPFSQHSARAPRKDVDYRHFVTAVGGPGSVVIFDGRVWHRAGANTTTAMERLGVSSGFHASWLDPTAGGWHLMKRGVRDRMPPEVRDMNRRIAED